MEFQYVQENGVAASTGAEKKANIEKAIRQQLKQYFIAYRESNGAKTAVSEAQLTATSDFGV